jgi:hypothetical protein
MKYLNEVSTQFTHVTDEHARSLMETLGYTVAAPVAENIYQCGDSRFTLAEEVIEGSDDSYYVRLDPLSDQAVVSVDESGRESRISEVSYEERDYVLEGVYDDGEGNLYARLVCENEDGEEVEEAAEEAEEAEEAAEEAEEAAEEAEEAEEA